MQVCNSQIMMGLFLLLTVHVTVLHMCAGPKFCALTKASSHQQATPGATVVAPAGGKTWAPAQLQKVPHSKPDRAWAWTLWEATLPVPEGFTGPLDLVCKATDASYNTQPETAASVWNIRGLANNAWHRVAVTVADE